jgi:cytochrome c peroxidase
MRDLRFWVTATLFAAGAGGLIAAGALAGKPAPVELTPTERLGKALFFDNISSPAWMSCATCHSPAAGWTGKIAGVNAHGVVYRGAQPQRFGNRKPPSSAYASFSPLFHFDATAGEFVGGVMWDGRATGEVLGSPVADQAQGPFLSPVEQNTTVMAVCQHVAGSKYAGLYEQAFGTSVDCSMGAYHDTYDNVGRAIGAYEGSREMNSFSSKFDAYWYACLDAGNSAEACGLADGEQITLDPLGILTAQEFDGLIEFGEYCSACHTSTEPAGDGLPPLFTNNGFANIGVPKNPANPWYRMDRVYIDGEPINPQGAAWIDYGLGDFLRTRSEWANKAYENDGKHRTPTVRNVDARPGKGWTKAYMHNGAFKSLEEVVSFYNTRDVPAMGWAPAEVDRNVDRRVLEGVPLGNFELDAEAEAAIVAFLRTLTDRELSGPPIGAGKGSR